MTLCVRHGLLAATIVAFSLAAATTAQAGKPGGGGGTTPPPPVRYRVNYFAPPAGATNFNRVSAMNESAAMVGDCYSWGTAGSHRGFLYDPLIDPQQAIDLNDLVQVPAGWLIRAGLGINDRGAIVAAIIKLSALDPAQPGYEIHGLLIDTRQPLVDGKWASIPIPDLAPMISYSKGINNNGDIVGVFEQDGQIGGYVYNTGLYRESGPDPVPQVLPFALGSRYPLLLNDPVAGRTLQVVGLLTDGTVFEYTAGAAGPESFPALSTYDVTFDSINGYGEFCGGVRVRKSKGNQTVLRPFRFDPELQSSPTLLGSETEHAGLFATDVNNSSDVVAYGGSNIGECLFHKSAGAFNLDSLVTGTADEVNLWLNFRSGPIYMTERVDLGSTTVPGFPVLGTTGGSIGAVLVPVLP